MAQVNRSQPSRDQVRVQRKEVSPMGLRKEGGSGMQEGEGTGQQNYMKHLSFPLPLEGVGQEWLGGLGPATGRVGSMQKEEREYVITGALF